jgi:hypothetical protein
MARMIQVWKVKHVMGDDPPRFTYSLKTNGFYPLVLSEEHFTMLFPEVNTFSVPEAPETAKLDITGTLIL